MSKATLSSSLLTLAIFASVCGCGEPDVSATFVAIQGAAIDGSEDVVEEEVAAVEAGATELEEDAVESESSEGGAPVEPDPEPEEATPEEPEDKGPLDITFWDISLEELDADAMLDVFLFPEEWSEGEREELSFPPDIIDLVGREISIEGYVIPGKMVDGNLRDFMLVRDLQACCFGGAPRADEWIDVIMEEDSSAPYHRYLPVVITGTFGLGGQQDNTGRALGVFKMTGKTLFAED